MDYKAWVLPVADTFKLFTWPRVLGLLVGAGGAYFWGTLAPDQYSVPLTQETDYAFYSGAEGGEFARVAERVHSRAIAEDRFELEVKPTNGSLENAQSIATTRRAVGLIGEVTAGTTPFTNERIQSVAPLYLQKAQLLYRKSRLVEFMKTCSSGTPLATLRLIESLDPCVRQAMSRMIFHAGLPGSGTRLVASYLMSIINVQPAAYRSGSFDNMFSELESKEPIADMVFAFSAPSQRARTVLAKDADIGVASIDPTLATAIKARVGMDLLVTTLSEFRVEGRSGSEPDADTVGSYAWFVASKDVPAGDLEAFIRWLDTDDKTVRKNNRSNLERVADRLGALEWQRKLQFWEMAVCVMAACAVVAGWALSHKKRVQYLRVYSKLRDDVSRARGGSSLQELEEHVASLETVLSDVTQDFVRGLLTVKHRDGLTGLLESLERKLVAVCQSRVARLARLANDDASVQLIERWYERGYLDRSQYDKAFAGEAARNRESMRVETNSNS